MSRRRQQAGWDIPGGAEHPAHVIRWSGRSSGRSRSWEPACASVIRAIAGSGKARSISLGTLIQDYCFTRRQPESAWLLAMGFAMEGYRGFRESLALQVPALRRRGLTHARMVRATRPSGHLLARTAPPTLAEEAPKFTIIMPVYNVREDWLERLSRA